MTARQVQIRPRRRRRPDGDADAPTVNAAIARRWFQPGN